MHDWVDCMAHEPSMQPGTSELRYSSSVVSCHDDSDLAVALALEGR